MQWTSLRWASLRSAQIRSPKYANEKKTFLIVVYNLNIKMKKKIDEIILLIKQREMEGKYL